MCYEGAMARNATTFPPGRGAGHGGPANGPGFGAGWGGSAKGKRMQFGQGATGGRALGVKNGEGRETVASLMIAAGGREEAAARWLAILQDPAHPHHATMLAKAAERMDGMPLQPMAHAAAGFVIAAPEEAEDAVAWAETYRPR
jgi:hypothetical protein